MQNLGIDQDFFQAAGDLSESPRGSVAQPSHIASPRGEFMGRSFRPSDIRCPGTREILKIMLDEEWGFLEAEAVSLEGFGGWKLHGLVKPDTVSLGIDRHEESHTGALSWARHEVNTMDCKCLCRRLAEIHFSDRVTFSGKVFYISAMEI